MNPIFSEDHVEPNAELRKRQQDFFEWRRRRLQQKNKELMDFIRKEIEENGSISQAKLIEFVMEKK